jgi:hypothetical protein
MLNSLLAQRARGAGGDADDQWLEDADDEVRWSLSI